VMVAQILSATIRKPFVISIGPANELENRTRHYRAGNKKRGNGHEWQRCP
jgi:hypothetical protein